MCIGTSELRSTGSAAESRVDWADELGRYCVGRTRHLGLHFLGHVLGITAVKAGAEQSVLRMDPPAMPGQQGLVTPVGLATLADLSMSLVIRRSLPSAVRLGTTTLTVQIIRDRFAGPVVATAQFAARDQDADSAHATCMVRDVEGRTVAIADSWFVVLPLPIGRTLPQQVWEEGESNKPKPVARDALTRKENAAVKALNRAARAAHEMGIPVSEALLPVEWSERGAASAVEGSMLPGPALVNRVGHIQGGALFGMGVAAAERVGGPGARIVTGHLQYLSPVPEASLRLDASVLRRGRRASFVSVGVSVAERPHVAGLFTCALAAPALDK